MTDIKQVKTKIRILKQYYQEQLSNNANKDYCQGNLHSLEYIEYMISED